jgi:hypothetical protein
MLRTCLYQISHRGAEPLDPGFRVLDNLEGNRPDWYEYWPIRSFLLRQALEENTLYGFLSPKFKTKTNLGAASVERLVAGADPATDVVLLSPSLHLTAYHLNVFQYGESCHPGLLGLAQAFIERSGRPVDLKRLVTHSRNEVYSNYFLARPRFWHRWLELTESLFAIAEDSSDALGARLCRTTTYRGERRVQMKVFILERLATLLLARDRDFRVLVHDPFAARSRLYKVPGAILCDALKQAYDQEGRGEELETLFPLVSRNARRLALRLRIKSSLGFRRERACLDALAERWSLAGRS